MSTDRIEIYVHPNGSRWADGSRGYPAGDLATAMTLLRRRREPGQRAVVWIAGGRYVQSEPLVLDADDSLTSFCALDPENPPVFEGAAEISGWAPVEVAGRTLWAAPAPTTAARGLWIDGERRARPRYPRDGRLQVAEQEGLDVTADFVGTLLQGTNSFRYAEGDIPPLAEPTRVEVVVPHYWVQERMPIGTIDRERREITSPLRSIFPLRDDQSEQYAFYYLDNVAESLGEVPGEWYLDAEGTVSGLDGSHVLYAPAEGDDPEALVARLPLIDHFVELAGDTEAGRPVREVRFEGVHFAYADFAEVPPALLPFGNREDPQLEDVPYASEIQAASRVPAAIRMRGSRSCAFVDGAVEHVGGFAIELGAGSRGCLVGGSRLADLGAGAVRIEGDIDAASPLFSRGNEVSDNDVEKGGRVYPGCVAILVTHGAENVIAHNHVRDFFYSAISVGWMWDYLPSPSSGNLIIGNHLHDLGQGVLNDMGGIYLLGIAPGTVLRGNRIHDIRCANYGGWGIYLDEGSSHVLIEGNVVYDTDDNAFHIHYGRENVVRDNVFAFGGHGQVSVTRPEEQGAATFLHNILVGEGAPGFCGAPGHREIRGYQVHSDLNLFWDLAPVEGAVRAGDGLGWEPDADGTPATEIPWRVRFPADAFWAEAGHDLHSVTADPRFLDLEGRDFRVAEDSPAHALGIHVPDVENAGPRPKDQRRHPLSAPTLADPFPPTQAKSVF